MILDYIPWTLCFHARKKSLVTGLQELFFIFFSFSHETFEWQSCQKMNFKGGKETSLGWPKSVNSRIIRNSQLAPGSVSWLFINIGDLYSGIRNDICQHSYNGWFLLTQQEDQFQLDLDWLHRWSRLFFSWVSQSPSSKNLHWEALHHPFPLNLWMKADFESCWIK